MRLDLIDEFRISPDRSEQIRALLAACFPDAHATKSRTYLKQRPARRLLGWHDGTLVAHLGLEHRVINLAGDPAQIFGIIDLCVAAPLRSRGLASQMLSWVEDLGRTSGVEFIVLFAFDPRIYLRNGFTAPGNPLRWVKIHEHEIIGIGEESITELVVKPTGRRTWRPGLVDLLGYQF